MKARIKFEKHGAVKYIGHLDMMRYFQKAMRRADIDISYSTGYSPHQIMSFALPLGVGVESSGEYLDVELNSDIVSSELMTEKLNSVMADGVIISEFRRLPDLSKTAMSMVAAADYEITLKSGYEYGFTKDIFETIEQDFFENSEKIMITKRTKKSAKVVDIKPLIYNITSSFDADNIENSVIKIQVAAGSENNLKPQLVINAICNYYDFYYNEYAYNLKRTELYAVEIKDTKKIFIPLKDMGDIVG